MVDPRGATPAERAEAIATLCEKEHYLVVAERLSMSPSHVRNFVRLRKRLTAKSFISFLRAGHGAKIRDWIAICALEPAEQEKKAALFEKQKKRRP